MSMKVGIGGQNGAVLASQAEGCGFKSRFPLQKSLQIKPLQFKAARAFLLAW